MAEPEVWVRRSTRERKTEPPPADPLPELDDPPPARGRPRGRPKGKTSKDGQGKKLHGNSKEARAAKAREHSKKVVAKNPGSKLVGAVLEVCD